MNRNLIIGSGAVLPSGVTQDAVVLGSVNSTVYLGGGAVQASATALKIATPLYAGGATGAAGQILKSTGAGIEWATAGGAPAAALTFTGDTPVTSANSVYVFGSAATAARTLILPAVSTLVGVPLSIKNQSLYVLTVNAPATTLVAPATTAVITTAPIASGGSCQIVSDGTNWLMLNAAGAPATPSRPTGVILEPPLSGVAPATLTVKYNVQANTTSFLVQISQIVGGSAVFFGAASAAASGTDTQMAVAVPATAGTYNTASADRFRAYVTPFNGWVPGPVEISQPDSDFSKPTYITIATPIGGNSPVGLTVSWTAPAFTPESNTVDIVANATVIGTVSALGTATSATVPNVDVKRLNPITARVTVNKGSFSSVASSTTGYTWTVPVASPPTGTFNYDIDYGISNVSCAWTTPYGSGNYTNIRVELWHQIHNGFNPPSNDELVDFRDNFPTNTTTCLFSGPYSSYNGTDPWYYYYKVYYVNWGGYDSSATSVAV
jgi:hypothetical protein